jgi:peptidoglycan/xylan/chitin deacetylase (PgdA/CDA1 family)
MRQATGDGQAGAGQRAPASAIRRRSRASIIVVALAALLSLAGTAVAAPVTTVSLTFDDGRPSQMAAAQQLVNHDMTGTFYIITARVGQPGVMAMSDLDTLAAEGMEIGAHTVLHPDLATLASDEAKRELCLSRNWLMDRGFDVFDMAYPYDSTSTSVEQLAAACGYDSARTGGQLQCNSGHACAETIPPLDAYSLRTPPDFNMSTTLAQMKAAVSNAESNGGGWVPLELHDVCDGPGDPLLPAGAQCAAPDYITRATYGQFLDWLEGEVDAGRVQVKTVHEVVGGALQPEVIPDPVAVRTGNLLLNPSYEQAAASGSGLPSDCWGIVSNGPDHPPAITTTSDAHSGSKALAISVPSTYDSWAYDLIAPVADLGQCAPAAVSGHHYTFTGWYKGNGQIRVVAYWRNADYQWARLDWGAPGTATFAAASSWTKASLTFQAPAGATAVTAGFYVDGTAVNRSSGNSYTIDDTSLADNDANTWALTVAAAGTGSGTVTSTPAGIACGATCQASFVNGASVTLSAAAAPGSSFTSWSGACSGSATTCTVAMSSAKSVTATFTLLPVPLTVATAGTGAGSVTSSPAGIDCGATCQASFVNGATVTLTAVAAADSTFGGWSGACSGMSATCTVTLASARSVTASFTAKAIVTVTTTGTGSGRVGSSPLGIDCGATCQAAYATGTTLTLTAVAAPGASFTGWSGACSGSAVTCTLDMTADRSASAMFTADAALTVGTTGTGGGSVASSSGGIDCGAACQASYTSGTTVTLTAVAAPGSTFMGWSGDCTGSAAACTLDMTADRTATALFTTDPALTVRKTGTGSGSVASGPSGIACGASCSEQDATYAPGTAVTLTALAADGSTFAGWSDASCAGATTCTVALDAARTVTATFTLIPPAPVPAPGPAVSAATVAVAGPTATSAPVTARAPAAPAAKTLRPSLRRRPVLAGRALAGRTLTCSRGQWSGNPVSYGFTWRRDGKAIIGHGSAYSVRAADRGHAIRCDVTAKNARGSATAASGAVRVPR